MSDAQIYNTSELEECLENGNIGFRDPVLIPNDDQYAGFLPIG